MNRPLTLLAATALAALAATSACLAGNGNSDFAADDIRFSITPAKDPAEVQHFLDTIEAGVLYVNRRAGATTGAWPGIQAFGGWKGSGSTGKAGLSMYYVAQFMREQSRTIVD